MSELLLPGYGIDLGSSLDRALLVKFMQRTYGELEPAEGYSHLAHTVDQYLSQETPLWWVRRIHQEPYPIALLSTKKNQPIACLWLGTAIDQVRGDRHTHIFLLYVDPTHRRRGIATALMRHAEAFAKARGDRQIGLQVFQSNQAALNLYEQLGFRPQSLWMVKPLVEP